jgi:hypothetical protein
MSFKDKLNDLVSAMDEAANEAAAGLQNQNLADIIRLGAARVRQAMDHPDCAAVGEKDQSQLDLEHGAPAATTEPYVPPAATEPAPFPEPAPYVPPAPVPDPEPQS